jgi:acetyl/propionyl-CoA carboxylase alpha subunit
VDEALKVLQDQWKVGTVHLFVGAPASACLKLGQKLQARHHATVVVYETVQGSKGFEETIRITRREARHEPTGESFDLNP